ncbi:hypothetical protein [Hymenobacter properus]|uniref:Outer membrane protein beta-barrel domain-containing protein n=1 Tax=Hymenobacter properus TaxID=2791026 RepID=A0A931BFD9_9BACT|nr:hypothetical protein [Hymenobacter properus]MBF9142895.1 hypothetical protein [Hymenobacter properus]MBR7721702.1 hypothetical protein [Microvirga sp. SRT04]
MKKYLLLIGLLAAAKAGHAQSIASGTVSLTGNIGYSRSTNTNTSGASFGAIGGVITRVSYTTETTNSQFNTAVSGGYFVADNLAVGLNVGFSTSSSSQKITASSTIGPIPTVLPSLKPNNLVQAGAFVQYYNFFSEQFGVVGTLGGGYQHGKAYAYSSGITPEATSYSSNGYYASLTPGIVFFPIPKIGISASIGSLGFSHLSNDFPESAGSIPPDGYENTSNFFGANFGLNQLQFGATYYFGR